LQLHSLTLRHLRNIGTLDWAPGPGINLIWGENGQGKTNLLEGIHLALTGRSFRTRRDVELLPWAGASSAGSDPRFEPTLAQAKLTRVRGTRTLRVMLAAGGKRAFADGRLLPTLAELLGEAAVVTFTPDSAGLLKEAPQVRRRWLDWTLAQLSPAYLQALQRFSRGLRQLNAILRSEPRQRSVRGEAAAYFPLLAEAGAQIMLWRAQQLASAGEPCGKRWSELGGAGELDLFYQADLGERAAGRTVRAARLVAQSVEAIAVQYAAALETAYAEMRQHGTCHVGPHRDDFTLRMDGKDLRTFGSQGQHRLAALSLQLESARWIEQALGEPPMLLLDDFGSELDPRRRAMVLAGLRAQGM
jgi:DNA replication and repair protein RecF